MDQYRGFYTVPARGAYEMNKILFPLPFLVFLFFISCAKPSVETPVGFAEAKSREFYRAVSPEGMQYILRKVKNYPRKELPFWGETLKNHLLEEGYHLRDDGGSFQSEIGEGMYFEWIVPYGTKDYIYLTAVVVHRKKIFIAEATAEHTIYRKYRNSLLESIKTLSIGFL
jgi:hypothetical protein